jgi:hypothetical protein
MGDLRAPDPTLDVHGDEKLFIRVWESLPVAHRRAGTHLRTKCRNGNKSVKTLGDVIPAFHAKWFAVPCRTCFPDAPPPGHLFVHGPTEGSKRNPYPLPQQHLAWQVSSSDRNDR